jgi:hypothetical protein
MRFDDCFCGKEGTHGGSINVCEECWQKYFKKPIKDKFPGKTHFFKGDEIDIFARELRLNLVRKLKLEVI